MRAFRDDPPSEEVQWTGKKIIVRQNLCFNLSLFVKGFWH